MSVVFALILVFMFHFDASFASTNPFSVPLDEDAFFNDTDLKAEVVIAELGFPVAMTFLGNDDFLVLERNNGYNPKNCRWNKVGKAFS